MYVNIITFWGAEGSPTVSPPLSEPRLSGSQNNLARDMWITLLSHQRMYISAFSVARVFSLLDDGGVYLCSVD